jgi:release factor glutamine methyltransferase
MKKAIQFVTGRFYRPLLVRYLARERRYTYKGIRVDVAPGVFHPGFFFSTKFLLRFLARQPLQDRSFLELGAGSGLISLFAASRGAVVTATDINPVAVSCLQKNSSLNSTSLEIIQSDLYTHIPRQPFDILAINPPYYRKTPVNDMERAWYCGAHGEYFEDFFSGLGKYTHPRSEIWMVLCEGCDLDMIRRIAARQGWMLHCARTRRNFIERDYIFQIVPLMRPSSDIL